MLAIPAFAREPGIAGTLSDDLAFLAIRPSVKSSQVGTTARAGIPYNVRRMTSPMTPLRTTTVAASAKCLAISGTGLTDLLFAIR